ncbi:conserved exported protein of unknown function [Pseudodesulfovibrio profundus]|uniref:Uncharacterized protein n=1 Tax=Pseudodesulfovibrio profundus TaxID=57320 RepID=A0A2C8F4I3_9BACT|nr:hypothetical protein [Pseudodesulfovibrio profundus]MBC16285.1 hypothetical protein [Desulfovibrio sp.]SOB56918.1 conserved exported protein of unknown function [Pseudodesulfovibrio profundus]|tara:strand:+ start:1533 stop:1715 length:183 start_codon:yes stop_codon:yes gene_type:complete
MNWLKYVLVAVCLTLMLGFSLGCEQEGPAEKAGKTIDQTVEDVGDSIEDAGDKIEDKLDN